MVEQVSNIEIDSGSGEELLETSPFRYSSHNLDYQTKCLTVLVSSSRATSNPHKNCVANVAAPVESCPEPILHEVVFVDLTISAKGSIGYEQRAVGYT